MRLYLKTDGNLCELYSNDNYFSWEAGRELSKHLHKFIYESLQSLNKDWQDIDSIVAFKGPGSYTALRIGLTVVNTLANGLNIPIVGTEGKNWRKTGDDMLKNGENHQIVLPIYYQDAVITKPKK